MNYQIQNDDDGMLVVTHNPYWPSSHAGFAYTPLDVSWRTENTEWYQAFQKQNPAITQHQKEISRLSQQPNSSTGQQEVLESIFGEANGITISDEKRKEENGFKHLITWQMKITENLNLYLQGYTTGDIYKSQSLVTALNQLKLQLQFNTSNEIEFSQLLVQSYNSFIDQRELASKNYTAYKIDNNRIYLENSLKTLQNCIESSAKQLKFYPVATVQMSSGNKKLLFPQVEYYMLKFPAVRNFLFYQLYLANVLRHLGYLQDAQILYQNLISLSQAPQTQTVSSLFTMMSSTVTQKTSSQTQQYQFPDARIGFMACLLQQGFGKDLIQCLEFGSKFTPEDDQLYINQNICRSQTYYGSSSLQLQVDPPNAVKDELKKLETDEVQQRYHESIAVGNFVTMNRCKSNCACCGIHQQQFKKEQVHVSKSGLMDFKNGLFDAVLKEDPFETFGTNGVEFSQVSGRLAQSRHIIPPDNDVPVRNQFTERRYVDRQQQFQFEEKLPVNLDPFGNAPQNLKQKIEEVTQFENSVLNIDARENIIDKDERQTQRKIFKQFQNNPQMDFIKYNQATSESYSTRLTLQLGMRFCEQQRAGQKPKGVNKQKISVDGETICALIKLYQSRNNLYIYQSPLSRFITFGAYLNLNRLEVDFQFDQLKSVSTVQNELFSNICSLEYFGKNQHIYQPITTSAALYTYVLMLINKRVAWANTVAKIIKKEELLNQCCCGLGTHSISKDLSTGAIANSSRMVCGCHDLQQQATKIFVEEILKQYPAPKLPSLQLLYLAFNSNPIIVEFLLNVRRLPDVASMRQIFMGFSDNQESPQLRRTQNFSRNAFLGLSKQQQLSMEASLYVSEFGHFWQSDELQTHILKNTIKAQLIYDGSLFPYQKFHFHQMIQSTVFTEHDQFIPYSALDFVHLAYLKFVDFEIQKLLLNQIQLNNSHFEQMLSIAANSIKDEDDQKQKEYVPTHQNQFGVPDIFLNLQNTDMFKANLYVFAFEKHLNAQSLEAKTFADQSFITLQRVCIRFLGDLLNVLPNIQVYGFLSEMMKYLQTKDKSIAEQFQAIAQQIQHFCPDFQSTLQNKIAKQKDKKKDKNVKKSQVVESAAQIKTKHQIELEEYKIDDNNNQDLIWLMFKAMPSLAINFAINQHISHQNMLVGSQLIQYMCEPGQTQSQMQQINQKFTCNTQIQQFNQYQELYDFQQILMSKYMLNKFDIGMFIKDEFIQKILQIICLNGLELHQMLYYEIITAQKYYSQTLKSLDGDIFANIYNNVEKETGNAKYDKPKDEPKPTLSHFAMYHTMPFIQNYFFNGVQNKTSSPMMTTNVICSSIPPQFLFTAQHFSLSGLPHAEKQNRQTKLIGMIEDYLLNDMVSTTVSIPNDYFKQLNLFYLSILSNKPTTLYTLMQNYKFNCYELIQGISLACFQGCYYSLRLLLNYTPLCFDPDTSTSQLNDLRTQIQQINVENLELLKKDSAKQLDVQKIISSHCITTNYLNETNPEMAAPIYWKQDEKLNNIKKLLLDKKALIDQIQQNSLQIQQIEQFLKQKMQQTAQLDNLSSQTKEIALQSYVKELKSKQELSDLNDALMKQSQKIDKQIEDQHQQFFFKQQEGINQSLRSIEDVKTFIGLSNNFQFHLLFMLSINSSAHCYTNDCFFCKIYKQFNKEQNVNIDLKGRCVAHYQVYQQLAQSVVGLKQVSTQQQLQLFVYNQLAQNVHSSFTTLMQQPEFDLMLILMEKYQPQVQITDLIEVKSKNTQQSEKETNYRLIPLTTPLTLAAQSNSELVQVMMAYLKQNNQAEVEKFINHQDYFGLSAAHHAMNVFCRLASLMLESQKLVDKFNQLGKDNKIQHAKSINIIKFQFRQAAINLKELLEFDQIQSFQLDKNGLSMRDKFILFLLHYQLVQGSAVAFITKQNEFAPCKIYPELLIMSLISQNDQLLKEQFESNKELKTIFKRYNIHQTADQNKITPRKQKFVSAITLINGPLQPDNQLQMYLKQQKLSISQESFGLSLDLQHPSLIKPQISENVYYQSELKKAVIQEICDVIRLLAGDEKLKDYVQFACNHSVEYSKIAGLIPSGGNPYGGSWNELPELSQYSAICSKAKPNEIIEHKVIKFSSFLAGASADSRQGFDVQLQEKYKSVTTLEKHIFTLSSTNQFQTQFIHADAVCFEQKKKMLDETNLIITNDPNKQTFLKEKIKFDKQREQVECMHKNLSRYSYRVWRLFQERKPFSQFRQREMIGYQDVQDARHSIVNRMVNVKRAQPLNIPKLARVQSDDEIFMWRKILCRVQNFSDLQDPVRIAFQFNELNLSNITFSEALRISALIDLQYKQIQPFEETKLIFEKKMKYGRGEVQFDCLGMQDQTLFHWILQKVPEYLNDTIARKLGETEDVLPRTIVERKEEHGFKTLEDEK